MRARSFWRTGNDMGWSLPKSVWIFQTLCPGRDLPISGLRGPASGVCPGAMFGLRPWISFAVFLQGSSSPTSRGQASVPPTTRKESLSSMWDMMMWCRQNRWKWHGFPKFCGHSRLHCYDLSIPKNHRHTSYNIKGLLKLEIEDDFWDTFSREKQCLFLPFLPPFNRL